MERLRGLPDIRATMRRGGHENRDRTMDRAGEDRRAERLKAALRDNLKRRKAQARGRAQGPAQEAPPVELEPELPSKPGGE